MNYNDFIDNAQKSTGFDSRNDVIEFVKCVLATPGMLTTKKHIKRTEGK